MFEKSASGYSQHRNIILIGMAGSGKSTVGRLLARALSCRFTDTDSLMEKAAGKPLQKIIDTEGLPGFLHLEEKVLMQLDLAGQVIATGGSSVYSRKGMERLRKNGLVIFLEVEPALLQQRIDNFNNRGLVRLPGQSFMELYHERLPLYSQYADHRVSCGNLNEKEICRSLVRLLREEFPRMKNKEMGPVRIIHIKQEPIELYKVLKLENLVGSGGEAKAVIASGLVRVNGAIETRKRKKILSNDIIEFNTVKVRVVVG